MTLDVMLSLAKDETKHLVPDSRFLPKGMTDPSTNGGGKACENDEHFVRDSEFSWGLVIGKTKNQRGFVALPQSLGVVTHRHA